jgi:WD40 repeat protein
LLTDVLAEQKRIGMEWLGKVHSTHVAPVTRNATNYVRKFSNVSRTDARDEEQVHDGPILPFDDSEIPLYYSPSQAPISSTFIPTLGRELSEPAAKTIRIVAEPTGHNGTMAEPEKIELAALESIDGLSKDEITSAARMAQMSRNLGEPGSETSPIITPVKQASRRQMTLPTSSTAVGPSRSRQESLEPVIEQRHKRIRLLVTGLKGFDVAIEWHVHKALVRHLQFSHDGKYLATCSWDRTTHLFRTFGEDGTVNHSISYPPLLPS